MSSQPKAESYVISDDENSSSVRITLVIDKPNARKQQQQLLTPPKERRLREEDKQIVIIEEDEQPKVAEIPLNYEQQPLAKKPKLQTRVKRNENNEAYWPLSGNKRITVSEFHGRMLVHIREYYMAGDQMRPGKKGIALSVQDFELLASLIDEIKSQI